MLQEFSVRSENNNNIKFFRVIIIRFLRTIGVSDYQFHIVILVAGRTRVLTVITGLRSVAQIESSVVIIPVGCPSPSEIAMDQTFV